MTIRFTKSWNGYYEGQIVTNPAGGNTEAQLIALGYAVSDLDGPDNSFELAKFATDSTGNVTGLAGPGGKYAVNGTMQDTCVLIGDSRNWSSYAWDDATKASAYLGSGSTLAWLQYISRVQFDCKGVAAKSGQHLADALTNFDLPNAMSVYSATYYGLGDVDLTEVKWAFVMLGVNDLQFWSDTYYSVIDSLIARLGAVENIVWIGESAVGAGSSGWGTTYPPKRAALNAYLRAKAATNPKLTFIDLEAESLDAVSATGLVAGTDVMNTDISGNTVASVHPTSKYHRTIAAKVLATIQPMLSPQRDVLAQGLLDVYPGTAASTNAFSNSMLTATGAASGTGISGTIPTGMTATIIGAGTTVVCSVVLDVFGYAAVFEVTHATPGTTCGVTIAFTGLGTDLINCSNPNKTQWLVDVSCGLTGAGALDLLPFAVANGAKPIGGMYRVKRSAYRTCYMLDHSSTAADTSNLNLKHTEVFAGVMSSSVIDTSELTGAYIAGASNTYANITASWKADGTKTMRVIVRRPTLRMV